MGALTEASQVGVLRLRTIMPASSDKSVGRFAQRFVVFLIAAHENGCPGLASWEIFSRPCARGDCSSSVCSTQDCVLGYFQPAPFDRLRAGSAGLEGFSLSGASGVRQDQKVTESEDDGAGRAKCKMIRYERIPGFHPRQDS
jgi:hypothetical protein